MNLTEPERRRVERIDQLVALGAAGVPELMLDLSDPSWTVRRTVVGALAALGDDAVGPLASWLVEARTTEAAIAAAVDALSASSGATVNAAMVELLLHPRPAFAADADQVLGRRRATEAATDLVRTLGHADDNVAVAAIEALGSIGSLVAIEALIEVLATRSFFRTFPALQILSRTNDPRVVAPIASLLDDELYRAEAIRALGRTGHPHAVEPLAGVLARGAENVPVIAQALFDLVERAAWIGAADLVTAEIRRVLGAASADFAAAVAKADGETCKALACVLGWIGDASVLPVLATLLDDPAVHDCARESIHHLVRTDPDTLLVALASDSVAMRAAALAVTGTSRAGTAVRELLADPEPEIRARACEALGRIGDPGAVDALFETLADRNPRVVHAATAAIHSLGSDRIPVLTIAALRHGSPVVRRAALRIVAYLGIDEAFDEVRAAIADPDVRLAELAIGALGRLSVAEVDPLLASLATDPREPIRAAVMRAAALRETASTSVLETGLSDEAAWVRYYACQSLGRLGHASSTDLVIARLADPAAHVRIAALEALGHLGGDAALATLHAAARSPDEDVRRAALASLGRKPNAAAVGLLLEAARSPDLPTRLVALSGLANVHDPAALAELQRAAQDADPQIAEAALSLLADRTDADAARILVDVALATAAEQPVHAALSRPSTERIAAIESRLATEDAPGATTVVAALARMHDVRAIDALIRALAASSPTVRLAAAGVLGAVGGKRGRELVAHLAVADVDPDVRRACAAAVGG